MADVLFEQVQGDGVERLGDRSNLGEDVDAVFIFVDHAGDAADLSALRATSAIILFAMGVFVLARVARPLNGWRGVLVAVFAAAGVIGAFVPFVANFFALILPTGATMVATLIALAGSALIFALCLWLAPLVRGLTGKLSRRH